MAIYTKTGDKGNTKVFDKRTGELVGIRKDSCHIKTIGAIDELNSFLGIVKSCIHVSIHEYKIERIQGNLFTINSILAGSKLKFSKSETTRLEKQIDEWEGKLPVQMNFIYYGGSQVSSLLFYARALCRKAERSLVAFAKKQDVPEEIKIYLNRLSDYLFMLARSVNIESGEKERFWITKK
jgi:cob(I)alamin adenosyltransferase